MRAHILKFFVLVCTFFLGLGIGFGLDYFFFRNSADGPLRLDSHYKFINPLLFCSVSENEEFFEFKNLEKKAEELLEMNGFDGINQKASVYYRDLNSGRWFGIDENSAYAPASLLKVSTMIAYYKYAEVNPDILNKKILYSGAFDENAAETYKPKKALQPGQSYSAEELIEYMIVYSDNNARRLLRDNIDPDFIDQIYTDLGLPSPYQYTAGTDFMSAKMYSYFFRALFNASYLNRAMSERALALLSKTDFPDGNGIIHGVPRGIPVSQKFGERVIYSPYNEVISRELHDCGVVYYPKHPYLLCIMTKGKDFKPLSEIIAKLSKLLYEQTFEFYADY